MNPGPFHLFLEQLSCKQFINAARRVPSCERDAKRSFLRLASIFHKPFSRSQRQLFGCLKNENAGFGFHGGSSAVNGNFSVLPSVSLWLINPATNSPQR